jgi:hypothetical protein
MEARDPSLDTLLFLDGETFMVDESLRNLCQARLNTSSGECDTVPRPELFARVVCYALRRIDA